MNVTATGDHRPDEGALFEVDTAYAVQVVLRGELDLGTVGALEQELREAWARDVRRIEIDLRQVTFIGSTGLAVLLEANARAREAGCELTLIRGPLSVHRIFELTGIESQFRFRATTPRADDGIARSGPLGIVS